MGSKGGEISMTDAIKVENAALISILSCIALTEIQFHPADKGISRVISPASMVKQSSKIASYSIPI